MAQEPYLLDPETLDPVSLYDPRYRRKRSRRMYDPRRRRASRRRRYDPQFRSIRRRLGGARRKVSKWRLLGGAIGVGAFTVNLTKGDMNAVTNQPANIKLGMFFRSLIGRTTGIDIGGPSTAILSSPAYQLSPSWNWTKALNNMFYLGLGASVYGAVSRMFHLKLPYAGKATTLGVPLAIGSLLGGGLDPSPGGTSFSKTGPQITRPAAQAVAPASTYSFSAVPSSLPGGLNP